MIVSRYKMIHYDTNVMRQTACMVVIPIKVHNFASRFKCTAVVGIKLEHEERPVVKFIGDFKTILRVPSFHPIQMLYKYKIIPRFALRLNNTNCKALQKTCNVLTQSIETNMPGQKV